MRWFATWVAGALAAALASPAFAADLCTADKQFPGSVWVRAPRIELLVREGVIVQVTNRVTGEVHAQAPGGSLGDVGMPRGLGHLTGDVRGAGQLHSPWGEYLPYAEARPFHHPVAGGSPTLDSTATFCTLTWTGLDNGSGSFNEELALDFAVGTGGVLSFRARGQSITNGVFGALVPIYNLHDDHRVYVPSFGGVMYDRHMSARVRTLDRAPFFEAPVVALETNRGSLGLWIADPTLRQHMFFLSWTGESFGVAIEQLNLMSPHKERPFPYTSFQGVWVSLDAFSDSWVGAMTPYRNWYATQYAAGLALRASAPRSPGDIRVIVDQLVRPWENVFDAALAELGQVFGPNRVLIFEANARLSNFDENLPDYAFKRYIPNWNQNLHARGFRTMGYVNSHVVNFNSPGFNQHDVWNNGLPRVYGSFYDLFEPPLRMYNFENAPQNELIYLDPLWPAWRALHVEQMQGWKSAGFDFNYEDTAAPSGDWGNGSPGGDGLSAAQGSVALFQALQSEVGVAMATESCSDAVGFASRWPLRINQRWGDLAFRAWLMNHARPVASFIFGPDQAAWVPTPYAEDNFHRHLVVAVSDGLGGLGQFHALRATFRATRGDLGHAKMRARLFATEGLHPMFLPERGADTLAARYRSTSGGEYQYHVDESEQRMVGPSGGDIYARITGVTEKTTPLLLEGWPATWNGRVFGLEPAARYNLVDRSRSLAPADTDVLITDLTPGVKIARYYETESHILLVLDTVAGASPPASASVTLYTHSPLLSAWLNDAPMPPPPVISTSTLAAARYALALPARFVFVKRPPAAPPIGVFWGTPGIGPFIERETGIDRGGAIPPWHPNQQMWVLAEGGHIGAFVHEYGENSPQTIDYLVRVPSPNARIRLYMCTDAADTSTGVIAINGRVVQKISEHRNCDDAKGPIVIDVDVGAHHQNDLVLSLILDNGESAVSDLRLFSQPRFAGQ